MSSWARVDLTIFSLHLAGVHIHSNVSQNDVTFEIEVIFQFESLLKSESSKPQLGISALILCMFQFKLD